MITAEALTRSFGGPPVVDRVSFQVPAGSLCVLLGPNGAGKSTTIRMLLGLLPPDHGSGVVAGVRLPGTEAEGALLRRRTGLLTETPGCYDGLTGWENLELFARLYEVPDSALGRRLEYWLRRLALWEARDRPFGGWSKGMKQRLALIRALVHDPDVLFLDEPTSGLDPEGAREVRTLLRELRGEGRTILMTTHNLAEAAELADWIGVIRAKMLWFGPPSEEVQRARAAIAPLEALYLRILSGAV